MAAPTFRSATNDLPAALSFDPVRRGLLKGAGAGLVMLALAPAAARATVIDADAAMRDMFGSVVPQGGRIALKLPPLAESGNSVPLTVTVDSPMTEVDYVKRVAIFANHNPRPRIMQAFFTPRSGKAQFDTNIRLSGTQDVIAIAEMSDGSLWTQSAHILVTVGACDSLQMRF